MLKRVAAIALGWLALTGMQQEHVGGRIPGIEMWRLDCGNFTFTDANAFFSDTSEYQPGPRNLVGSCYLIRHHATYMLWDTGIPAGVVGHPLETPQLRATLRASVVDQLARIQVRPEQISIVAISHYHFDHTGQAAAFPRARLIMGAGDLAALRGTEPGVEREPLAPWLTGGGQITEARGDLDIFNDGSVVMLSLPGHTPGHRGLLVRLASGPVLLSGDTYHFTDQVARRGVPPFNTNRAESLAAMDRFDRLGRNLRARVIIQHEPADVAKLPAFPESAR
jgi:glyoxylase-like metal-dependent hydrolase (beta-lactamase superfamily II)